jgi:hypothetical protein
MKTMKKQNTKQIQYEKIKDPAQAEKLTIELLAMSLEMAPSFLFDEG